MTITIRTAESCDVADILRLIHDLATYEREPDAVETTPRDLRAALFPETGSPTVWCELAVGEHGQVSGMALWFTTFSTWTGKSGIWLEDLYVDSGHRGRGAGKALLERLASICVERGWTRLEWTVLTWNTPSIDFYRALGAVPQEAWTTHRLDGAALQDLAGAPTGPTSQDQEPTARG